MFQHCQPMRNHHTEQLQGGNGKINSEKVSGQSSSIQLVSPYIISPCLRLEPSDRSMLQFVIVKLQIATNDKVYWTAASASLAISSLV